MRISSKNKSRVKQWPDYEFYDKDIWVLRRKTQNIYFSIFYIIRGFSGDILASYRIHTEPTGETNSHVHLVPSLKALRGVTEVLTLLRGVA